MLVPAAASTGAGLPLAFPMRQSRVTSSVTPDTTARHVNLALSALATGGFAIGTTEFVTMGLLPQIADGVLLGLMAVFVLGNVLSSVASSYEFLMAARFLSGLPHGAFFGIGGPGRCR
jgi:DHA1 family inner membrane transport protein